MKALHYIAVARHFWPWDRRFWLGLLHDGYEDGWITDRMIERFPHMGSAVLCLSRDDTKTYAEYISFVGECDGWIQDVKVADLLVNYARASSSLRRRYGKALTVLAATNEGKD